MARFTNKYSSAGLDCSKIENIKTAITAYQTKLKSVSQDYTGWSTKVMTAIKGSGRAQEVNAAIIAIGTYCDNQIKSFETFYNSLDKLEKAYKNNDSTDIGISFTPTDK